MELNSSGSQKKFSTNIYEAVQINDLLVSSNEYINKFGFSNKISTLLKNVNSHGKNSSKYKKDEQSEVLSILSYDIEYPMYKRNNFNNDYFTPKLSLRFAQMILKITKMSRDY